MKPGRCKLFIDAQPDETPHVGLYIVTIGKSGKPNSVYMVTAWRKVNRRDPNAPPRFNLNCERGHSVNDARSSGDYWTLHWYPRDKKRPNAEKPPGTNGQAA